MFFNPKYGKTAFMILPFFLIFEFLVPIIEFFGIIALIAGIITEKINTEYLIIMSVFVYIFYLLITLISIMIDDLLYKSYANYKELMVLIFMAMIEPFVYHPLNIYASLRGYWFFFRQTEQKWGVMIRKGFTTTQKLTS